MSNHGVALAKCALVEQDHIRTPACESAQRFLGIGCPHDIVRLIEYGLQGLTDLLVVPDNQEAAAGRRGLAVNGDRPVVVHRSAAEAVPE
jgi:hypothetical protein